MKRIVIYHGNCADGFTAAWVAKKYFDEIRKNVDEELPEFFAAIYGNPPPDVVDKEVYIVDFSYRCNVMQDIIADAYSVVVLDHHQTAEADLKSLEGQYPLEKYECTFDMKRSGAMIAWNYFFSDIDPPYMLERVQDRDLWKFKFDDTRPLNSYLFSKEYTWENWDRLMASEFKEDSHCIVTWIAAGKAIDEKHLKDIKELLKVCTRKMDFLESMDEHGHSKYIRIPVANVPYTMGSDAADILAKENNPPVAAYYYDTPEGRNFGFRSIGDYDCSILAKYLGGGGHKNAAGANKVKADRYCGMEVGIDIKSAENELPMKIYPHVQMDV